MYSATHLARRGRLLRFKLVIARVNSGYAANEDVSQRTLEWYPTHQPPLFSPPAISARRIGEDNDGRNSSPTWLASSERKHDPTERG
jgi:hypothetical protein